MQHLGWTHCAATKQSVFSAGKARKVTAFTKSLCWQNSSKLLCLTGFCFPCHCRCTTTCLPSHCAQRREPDFCSNKLHSALAAGAVSFGQLRIIGTYSMLLGHVFRCLISLFSLIGIHQFPQLSTCFTAQDFVQLSFQRRCACTAGTSDTFNEVLSSVQNFG